MITMEIVIKTAAVTPPTTPLLIDAEKSVDVKEYNFSVRIINFDATFIILIV